MIIERFGEDFPRLRVGIGRGHDAIEHVLTSFSEGERKQFDDVVAAAADGVFAWLDQSPTAAMNFVNAWKQPGEEGSAPTHP